MPITDHLRVLGRAQVGALGVFLIEKLLVGIIDREEGASLDDGHPSSDTHAVAQGRGPGESLREHLHHKVSGNGTFFPRQ